mmetsp:Transcript_38836/g.95305  ORF Transcript_38836/g.95305 Transcript_38836/m.95305 type:complete len:156 (+) Transcript_38836:1-468(+)
MGLPEHSAIHHQHAIEYANRMGSKQAQSLAVGNLGLATYNQGDHATSRMCLQYHLDMSEKKHAPPGLGDQQSTDTLVAATSDCDAHMQLGQVSAAEGQYQEAVSRFARAIELARQIGDRKREQDASVLLGATQGMLGFHDHQASLLEKAPAAIAN